jgi:DNA invertase Pin-like site-specific DNA recombinase
VSAIDNHSYRTIFNRRQGNIFNSKRKDIFSVQKGPLSKEMHTIHGERVRAGQARARAEGKFAGRPGLYSDALIREAIRRHDNGETWAAVASMVGISVDRLYARVRKLRREQAAAQAGDANAKAT